MTVTEIAKIAGVSIGTVDRVLHHRGRVSQETTEKIQKIIKDNGYRTNPIARHLKRNISYKIGVFIPKRAFESGYWTQVYEGVQQGINDFSAFNFSFELFEFLRTDVNDFREQFANLVNSDCNVWIIAPAIKQEIEVLLSNCKNIRPYCFIDCNISGTDAFSSIYQNPIKSGYLAGKLTALCAYKYKEKKENDSYAIILPYTDAHNLTSRADGFTDYFKKSGQGKVIKIVSKSPNKESIIESIKQLLKEDKNVRGICTANAITHIVADYIYENKLNIVVTGFDLVPENCEALKNGKISCLIAQNPVEQAKLTVKQIYTKMVLEEPVTPIIEMPLEIFFKENL